MQNNMGIISPKRQVFSNYVKPQLKHLTPPNKNKHTPIKIDKMPPSCLPTLQPSPIYEFCSQKQFKSTENALYSMPDDLSVLTYNIWFDGYNSTNRYNCILALMEDSQADFICLQEVTQSFLQLLHKLGPKSWLKDYYMAVIPMHWYDTVILSKFKCRFYKKRFEVSYMERSMLLAQVFIENGHNVVVGSMHYESLNNTSVRIQQMKEVYSATKKAETVIIAGDYNFTDGWDENKSIPSEFKDIWKQCNVNMDNCQTMPKSRDFPKWRPDHIICRCSWRMGQSQIMRVGNFTIEPHQKQNLQSVSEDGVVRTPSDHFGLFSRISFAHQQP